MATAKLLIGDARTVLATLPDASVDCLITSPPYYRQRSYLTANDPQKAWEIGQESTPGKYLETLLEIMDASWRVLTDDATFWVNLGDKHWGSGGAGGDYNRNGLRDGQPKYGPLKGSGGLLAQSVCWLPDLFGASLAYGRNLLTGNTHRQWVTRPAVTWCKSSVMPGKLVGRFRTATELIIYGGKHAGHYFDLDSVREPHAEHTMKYPREQDHYSNTGYAPSTRGDKGRIAFPVNPLGAPPLNWWNVPNSQNADAHYAVFPEALLIRPVKAGCPAGGTILDPFCGTGSTLAVAVGHGRNAIGVDLDARNAAFVEQRVGMFLEVG